MSATFIAKNSLKHFSISRDQYGYHHNSILATYDDSPTPSDDILTVTRELEKMNASRTLPDSIQDQNLNL